MWRRYEIRLQSIYSYADRAASNKVTYEWFILIRLIGMPANAAKEKGEQKERSNNMMHCNGSKLRIRHSDERYL